MPESVNFDTRMYKRAQKVGVQVAPNRVIYHGIVFQKKDNGQVEIGNGHNNFYRELPRADLQVFVDNGFNIGVKRYRIKRYRAKVKTFKKYVETESNGRNNLKRIEFLNQLIRNYEETISKIEAAA